jgi:hypothetical protein
VSEDQLSEVVLTNSVVAFDGRVLELFGHRSETGNRIHVALITAIEDGEREIVIKVRGMVEYSIVVAGEDEAKQAEVRSLLDRVRTAGPTA